MNHVFLFHQPQSINQSWFLSQSCWPSLMNSTICSINHNQPIQQVGPSKLSSRSITLVNRRNMNHINLINLSPHWLMISHETWCPIFTVVNHYEPLLTINSTIINHYNQPLQQVETSPSRGCRWPMSPGRRHGGVFVMGVTGGKMAKQLRWVHLWFMIISCLMING